MSKSYTVIRKRAYWVREVMHIDSPEFRKEYEKCLSE